MADHIICKTDRFGGVLIDVVKQASLDSEGLIRHLKEAIVQWKADGRRGLWITVPTCHSCLIPELTPLGFDFHHAQPGFACLTKWLPEDSPSSIPTYANHFVGVGGFVVNTHRQLLVIKEKYQKISPWKLPGGLADAGEDLGETARREVLEETGVETEFVCIIGYRHMHNYRHSCSDLYYMCLMKPLSTEIKPCPQEVAECQWMALEEFEALESISDVNRYFVKKYRDILATGWAIGADQVLSYDKKSMLNVYSVRAF